MAPKVEFLGEVPDFQRFELSALAFGIDRILVQHMPPGPNSFKSPRWERQAHITIFFSVLDAQTGVTSDIAVRRVATYSITDELAAEVRRMIADFAAHEASHAIRRNGKPIFDPHPEETAALCPREGNSETPV